MIAIAQRLWLRISSWEPSFCNEEIRVERGIGGETRAERSQEREREREGVDTCYSQTFVNTLYRHFWINRKEVFLAYSCSCVYVLGMNVIDTGDR